MYGKDFLDRGSWANCVVSGRELHSCIVGTGQGIMRQLANVGKLLFLLDFKNSKVEEL